MRYTDSEYTDEYREQMLCDGLTEESLVDAGYSNGFDLLDDEYSYDAQTDLNYDNTYCDGDFFDNFYDQDGGSD